MKNNDYQKVQVILSSAIVLLLTILIVALPVIGNDVKTEVKSELSKLDLPDFSSVNELMDKFEPLLELVDEFNDPAMKYYFKEGLNFLKRFDGIEGADIMIELLPAMSRYYINESGVE